MGILPKNPNLKFVMGMTLKNKKHNTPLDDRVNVELPFVVKEDPIWTEHGYEPIYLEEGMKLVTMGWVKIKDKKSTNPNFATEIKIINENTARVNVVDPKHVDDVVILIKNGEYNFPRYEPPVVAIKLEKDGTFNKKS